MVAESRWAARFLAGSIILGAAAFVLMSVLLYLALFGVPAASRIVAGGGAGTWLVVGVIGFALVGVIGIGLSALFYQHLEGTLGAPYSGWRNAAGWVHLVVGGGGASAAALLTAYAGYAGGAALLSTAVGGGGQTPAWVHENILAPLVVPIAGLVAIALLGFFIGGVGYVTAWRAARKRAVPGTSTVAS